MLKIYMVFEYFYLVKYITISFHKISCGRVFNTKIENNLYCNQSLLSNKYVISNITCCIEFYENFPLKGKETTLELMSMLQ